MSASVSPASAPSSVDSGNRGPVAWGQLIAVALAAAGLGFSVFLYVIPYRKALRDLKMARGDLMQEKAEAAGRERELAQLRSDLSDAQRAAGEALVHVRSETAVLRLQLQEQTKTAPPGAVDVQVDARGVMVKLAPPFLFEGGGAALSATGAASLRAMGRAIGKGARRVIVTAPLGHTKVPAEFANSFPKAVEFTAERVKVVVQALSQAGVPVSVVWGVSTGGPNGDKDASIDIEIDPGA